jgi:hypothetical protein
MSRRRNVVRLGIPAIIVGILAVAAVWRIGPPPDVPDALATSGSASAYPSEGPLRRVVDVLADNAVGREASLEGIEVRQLTSATTFWAGSPDDKPVFAVVIADAKRAPGVRIVAGREVTLIGVVRPALSEQEMMRRWRLDAATAAAVQEAGTYLEVREIR